MPYKFGSYEDILDMLPYLGAIVVCAIFAINYIMQSPQEQGQLSIAQMFAMGLIIGIVIAALVIAIYNYYRMYRRVKRVTRALERSRAARPGAA